MKCEKCENEMKYYRDWLVSEEGYQCQRCGTRKIIEAIEIGDDEDALRNRKGETERGNDHRFQNETGSDGHGVEPGEAQSK